jgi:glycosyltransferase involved in cell wall biosynthesis
MKVAHVIAGLGVGGTELALAGSLEAWEGGGTETKVFSLSRGGEVGVRIRALGVTVTEIHLLESPLAFFRLVRALRSFRPDIVQTWMYHADLVGGVAALLAGCRNVIWGIRQSYLGMDLLGRRTWWVAKCCAFLSWVLPWAVVCNSRAGRKSHRVFGYRGRILRYIPNGVDVDRFRPDPVRREAWRASLKLDPRTVAIGFVGRFDRYKGHGLFLRAALAVARWEAGVRFILCGDGVEEGNPAFATVQADSEIKERFLLLGRRDDIPDVMRGLDGLVSASLSEGFPNVVAEAMACGVPCVATDVGDSARLIGDTGFVVPPKDPAAMARALKLMMDLPAERRRELGAAARRRIVENYGLSKMVEGYMSLYEEILREKTAPRNDEGPHRPAGGSR